MNPRNRARGWALQALYAWESRGAHPDEMVRVLQDLYENLNVSSQNRLHADVLIRLVSRNIGQIDALLKQNLTNWSLQRLSVIDRNLLRLGVAELLYMEEIPPRLTIREAVRVAEKYSTPESPRFIHGVLDAVLRQVEAERAPGVR